MPPRPIHLHRRRARLKSSSLTRWRFVLPLAAAGASLAIGASLFWSVLSIALAERNVPLKRCEAEINPGSSRELKLGEANSKRTYPLQLH
jgi:hypothetical protein